MKCLSLWQPWATLIAIGAKRIETRDWETAYRGALLIHAARRWTPELREMIRDEPFASSLKGHIGDFARGSFSGSSIPLGCIVGVCNLMGCYPTEDLYRAQFQGELLLTPLEREFGDYGDGRFGWVLSSIRRFETPIPFKGRQRIFNVPDELVAEQLRSAVPAC